MKTETQLLPDGVSESLFHIHCGGEVWTSRVCRGANLLSVLEEIAPGSEHYAEDLADMDNWYVLDGRCRSISLACGEDPDIEVTLIDDPAYLDAGRKLVALARAAHNLVDDSEAGAEGDPITVPADSFEVLSNALDALDALPELPPPFIGTGPAKAEHILGLSNLP